MNRPLRNFILGWSAMLLVLGWGAKEARRIPAAASTLAHATALDTVTYADNRIVYTVDVDTATNAAGQLRYVADITGAPSGARYYTIMKSNFDSAMLVTGDTFALSPTDSATATARAISWGSVDPYTITLAWHTTPEDSSEAYPNQPTGFAAIAAQDWACKPDNQVSCFPPLGDWNINPQGDPDLTMIDVSDSPSPADGPNSKVVRLRFPVSSSDGSAFTRQDGWGPDRSSEGNHPYDELYISFWLKMEGSDFENQTIGTKVFYVAYASTSRQNHSYAMFKGTGIDQSIMSTMTPDYYTSSMNSGDGSDPGGGAARRVQNVGSQDYTVGNWTQFEYYWKINSIGPTQDDGLLKTWVDGVLTSSYSNLRYRSTENPLAFYAMQITPVWGGNTDDARTRIDFWQMEDFYISVGP